MKEFPSAEQVAIDALGIQSQIDSSRTRFNNLGLFSKPLMFLQGITPNGLELRVQLFFKKAELYILRANEIYEEIMPELDSVLKDSERILRDYRASSMEARSALDRFQHLK